MSHSKACCTIPPVVVEGYKEKGEYITLDGTKLYSTGPKDAKYAILIVFDIFGFYPQTLQGADILAHSDKERPYQVFMPDLFDGKPAALEWYPPDNEDKGKKMKDFFENQGSAPKAIERIPKIVKAIQAERPSISSFGVLGFCWGGKVVNLLSQAGTPFKAAVVAHPAFVDAADAPGITIPFLSFPTKDENKEDVEKWDKAVTVKHKVQWWPDQIHGFMAARSDLKDPAVEAAYKKAYEMVLDWFHENIHAEEARL